MLAKVERQWMNRVRSSTRVENIRKFQTEVIELENTITELDNTLEAFNSVLDKTEQ